MHRRSGVWMLVLLLAGCGGAGIGDPGGPCGADKPCGKGLVCDMTDPAGPVCIEADGDLDGDGIPNDRDFCEHQAGGAFDEDRDGIGDECDRCPIAPPPATPDADGDDVDSPCDPDPATDGDAIVAFDGFNQGIPAGWTATAGWQVMGGEAIATPASPTVRELLTAPLPASSTHVAVLAAYRIDRADDGASENSAGVVAIDRRPAGTASDRCVGQRIAGADALRLDTDTSTASKPFMNLFDTAGLYRIAMQLEGAQAGCALIDDQETGAVQANTAGAAPTEAGAVALAATARFAYVLVVQRP